jgi:FMN phosphatase YigB (HAD superfamily)
MQPGVRQLSEAVVSPSDVAARAAAPQVRVVSTDIFDTVLLRDASTETGRLSAACTRSAAELDLDPRTLTRLRWWMQEDAYRAVALERRSGEARLSAIYAVIAHGLGLDEAAAGAMQRCEVDVDIEHLRPHRELIATLEQIASTGTRIIAVSDTYYSAADLARMLTAVVGPHPIAAIFSSADLGLTKHEGSLYDAVAQAEGVSPEAIVHVGDHPEVDVANAERAGWSAVHLPRSDTPRLRRRASRATQVVHSVRRLR